MRPKRPRDPNKLAKHIIRLATGEIADKEKDTTTAAAGRKGGKVRAQKLSAARRSAIARKAARARWKRETP